MKVFEFHFNPSAKADRFFYAACEERQFPAAASSEHFAFLGELNKALPQNSTLLKKLAESAKKEFAAAEHAAFSRALQKANRFLAEEKKAGNVDWVGNLHLVLFGLSHKQGEEKIKCSFTRAGLMKIFVSRKGMLTDAGKEIQDTEHVGSGTLYPNDKVIIMTHDVFKTFSEQNILHDLVFFTQDKQFRELFRAKSKELSKLAGALLVLCIEESSMTSKRKRPSSSAGRPLLPRFFTEWTFSSFRLPFRKEIAIVLSLFLVLAAGFLLFQ